MRRRASRAVLVAAATLLLALPASAARVALPVLSGISPAWSPDGQTIAYVAATRTLAGDAVFEIGADGTGAHRVATVRNGIVELRWAPAAQPVWDGDFRLGRLGTHGIVPLGPGGDSFSIDPSGTWAASSDGGACGQCAPPLTLTRIANGQRRVLLRTGSNSRPTFSPDGRFLAFARALKDPSSGEYSRREGIWRIGVGGAGLRELTRGGDCAAWSPNGRLIVYVAPAGGERVVSPSGTGNRLLTRSGACDAAWSPDSRSLALAGLHRLAVVDVATGKVRTPAPAGRYASPSWSPDGTEIAVTRTLPSRCSALVLVRADGSGATRLTRC